MTVRRRTGRDRRNDGPSPELVAWWARGRANLRDRYEASQSGDSAAYIRLRLEAIADPRPAR